LLDDKKILVPRNDVTIFTLTLAHLVWNICVSLNTIKGTHCAVGQET